MPQGLVQAAQAVQIAHDQFILAGLRQGFGDADAKGPPVQQAGQRIPIRPGELGLQGDDARRAQAVFQPDPAP